MSTNPGQAPQRIAHATLFRRQELGLSQLEVWQRGGPSNTTLTKIENGRLGSLSNSTAKRLDRGLNWPPGSAMRIWNDAIAPPVESVGSPEQDAARTQEGGYVEAPGAKVESGITNEELLREILRSRAEYDQLRAEVRENQRTVSERLDRLEKPDA